MASVVDGIALTLFQNRFSRVAEEMGETIKRSAFSTNIKERQDHSCALFTAQGEMIAQAAHIPVHLGAMPATLRAVQNHIAQWQKGDVAIVNDPFSGGTHLPDITLVTPVFDGPTLRFFLVSRAHHSDVGGMAPGSMPLSTEIFQEGLIIPPVKLFDAGTKNEALWQLIMKNTRTPHEREGDFSAQLAAHGIGTRRVNEMMAVYGGEHLSTTANGLLDYAEKKVRAVLTHWPSGNASFSDVIALPGQEVGAKICVELTLTEDRVCVDFSASDDQVVGPINAVASIVDSACFYVLRTLLPTDIPHNGGANRPFEIITRPGSLLHANPPAGVVGGNVETSQRIVDVLYGAFEKILPGKIPAASQGTMNNLTIGGINEKGESFTYYETIAGGHGASFAGHGLSGRHSHMTNTLNTPIEALEQLYPFRVECYALRLQSGGHGRFNGGCGIVRSYTFEKPAQVTLFSSRRQTAPYGLYGGMPGNAGGQYKIDKEGQKTVLPGHFSQWFKAGEKLVIETPGGGGYGKKDAD